MALPGPDQLAGVVELEAALVVLLDDDVQLGPAERPTVGCGLVQQVLDEDPSRGVHGQTDGVRVVAKPVGEPLGEAYYFFLIHVATKVAHGCR